MKSNFFTVSQVKMRVRYAESKQVKEMREHFEKAEKIALRSSKTYKVRLVP